MSDRVSLGRVANAIMQDSINDDNSLESDSIETDETETLSCVSSSDDGNASSENQTQIKELNNNIKKIIDDERSEEVAVWEVETDYSCQVYAESSTSFQKSIVKLSELSKSNEVNKLGNQLLTGQTQTEVSLTTSAINNEDLDKLLEATLVSVASSNEPEFCIESKCVNDDVVDDDDKHQTEIITNTCTTTSSQGGINTNHDFVNNQQTHEDQQSFITINAVDEKPQAVIEIVENKNAENEFNNYGKLEHLNIDNSNNSYELDAIYKQQSGDYNATTNCLHDTISLEPSCDNLALENNIEEQQSKLFDPKHDDGNVVVIIDEDKADSSCLLNSNVTHNGEELDDLELEFDLEPAFEARNVIVKRHLNIRNQYQIGDELGRGRFGAVFKCVENSTGRNLAVKFISTRHQDDRLDVEREVEIMCKLQHKRLLQLYDAFDDGQSEMCLVTELIDGGELFERIVNDDFELTEKKAAIFMRQICEGAEYMRSKNIVHLDLKPENILCVSRTGNKIKLIDFGLARELKAGQELRVMFGTPDFAAPEVLSYNTISCATDMWSIGVICYVLLSGLSPFMGDSDLETMANVMNGVFDFDDDAFEYTSDLSKDFISKLLVIEPSKRLSPSQCLEHSWLQRGGIQLEASVKVRRESIASLTGREIDLNSLNEMSIAKRKLKKYVIRRRWHKTVHAIMALRRMGAHL